MNSSENEEDSSRMNGRRPRPGTSASDVSPDDNRTIHNDCGKICSGASEGARTKIRHYNNIANGADHFKVNNNSGESLTCCRLQNGASTSVDGPVELDGYMKNNVDSPSKVEKCPSKVRNGSIDGNTRRKFRKTRCSLEEESSSGNEAEEDCCVYTYKGSLQADLPSSFFTLDQLADGVENSGDEVVQEPANEENIRSGAGSSPDNDFLEMDFDPGPSLDQDSEEEFAGEKDDGVEDGVDDGVGPVPDLPSEQDEVNDLSAANENAESAEYLNNVTDKIEDTEMEPQPGPSSSNTTTPICRPSPYVSAVLWNSSNIPRSGPVRDSWGHHRCSGDLCSPWDTSELETGETLTLWTASNVRIDGETSMDTRKYNHFSDLYHCIMAKRLVMDKNASFTDVGSNSDSDELDELQDTSPAVDKTMIWSEQEACNKQVTQISTSACGTTAVINVMMALSTSFSLEKLKKGVGTRLRQESAPLPQYLFSRSVAGATHEDLVRGVHVASEGRLFARFFAMYPERRLSLSKWISYWMKKGSVPIATLNLQAGLYPDTPLPDAWHHQMVFGVSSKGIYLANPLECVPEGALWPQLCSPSVLRVKRSDVLQRWTSTTDLEPLMCQTDIRWKKMNVLGQVINMVRESASTSIAQATTQYLFIPAAYSAGITLVIPRDSPGYSEMAAHPELPLLSP